MTARAAVMMYTVDALLDDHLEATLDRIASLGYLGVETYGLHGRTPKQYRAAADHAGLRIVSSHAPFPSGPHAKEILDTYAELGVDTLAWSMEREEFATEAAMLKGLERVNDGAANAAPYGMRIAYHNHFGEFTNTYGTTRAYDALIANLDPRVVLELDMYWTQMGGIAPASVLAGLGARVPLLHVKDGPALAASAASTYHDDVLVPIGSGALDMPAVLTANPNVQWHIVELERLGIDVWDALTQSYAYMFGNGYTAGSKTISRTSK